MFTSFKHASILRQMTRATMSERRERLDEITHDADLMDDIFLRVADDGNLVGICKELDVSYSMFLQFVKGNDSLNRKYLDAQAIARDRREDMVFAEFERIAGIDIRTMFDENGSLKPIHDLPDDVAHAIVAIDTEDLFDGRGDEREHIGIVRKVKLSGKQQALDSLAKTLKLYVEKKEIGLEKSIVELIAESVDDENRNKSGSTETEDNPDRI